MAHDEVLRGDALAGSQRSRGDQVLPLDEDLDWNVYRPVGRALAAHTHRGAPPESGAGGKEWFEYAARRQLHIGIEGVNAEADFAWHALGLGAQEVFKDGVQ